MPLSPFQRIDPGEFRILELHKGCIEDPIACKLHKCCWLRKDDYFVSSRGKYEAVSYSWGKSVGRSEIAVNGITIMIPPALADALCHLRQKNYDRQLWCDAICIDQNNFEEKAAQVSMMFTIFRRAMQVIAWIGLDDESTRFIDTCLHWKSIEKSRGCSMMDLRDLTAEHSERNEELLSQAVDLTKKQWFHRVWIRQEVTAARTVKLQCGSKRIGLERLFEYMFVFLIGEDRDLEVDIWESDK